MSDLDIYKPGSGQTSFRGVLGLNSSGLALFGGNGGAPFISDAISRSPLILLDMNDDGSPLTNQGSSSVSMVKNTTVAYNYQASAPGNTGTAAEVTTIRSSGDGFIDSSTSISLPSSGFTLENIMYIVGTAPTNANSMSLGLATTVVRGDGGTGIVSATRLASTNFFATSSAGQTDKWLHVISVFEQGQPLKQYINGVLNGTTANLPALGGTAITLGVSDPTTVGNKHAWSAIYPTPFSASDVTDRYSLSGL
jgi:hypothetical protein